MSASAWLQSVFLRDSFQSQHLNLCRFMGMTQDGHSAAQHKLLLQGGSCPELLKCQQAAEPIHEDVWREDTEIQALKGW